ncbi:MAG: GTPase Era [Tunicatimonas sp.]
MSTTHQKNESLPSDTKQTDTQPSVAQPVQSQSGEGTPSPTQQAESHRAGFVSIVGKPNVGKSTLMNALVGERLSIITSKAQTTRHRIMGIVNGDDFQIVYSDTPGLVKPQYELHQAMMRFVDIALEDADVILFVTDLYEKYEADPKGDDLYVQKLIRSEVPVVLVMNKIDLAKGSQALDKMTYWQEIVKPAESIMVSALEGLNVGAVLEAILQRLPEHPPYFDKDQITDKPERFFAAEIVREKIFVNYKQEVPYSSEVVVTEFKEDEQIIRMRCEIYVERASQKGILIGKGGAGLKKVGIQARADLEQFFGKQVHLEQHVKVVPNWRREHRRLQNFGYRS